MTTEQPARDGGISPSASSCDDVFQRAADALRDPPEQQIRDLRRAAAEALLSGGLLLADVSRTMSTWNAEAAAKVSEERFRKAMEMLREALS